LRRRPVTPAVVSAAMERPTRQEQAQSILERKAWQLASQILGRRATNAADFAEAFNLERIDLIAAIPDVAALLALGRNVVGPRDGLYVIEEDDGLRIYIQERGVAEHEYRGLGFDKARDLAIDMVFQLGGIPYRPPG